MKYKVIMVFTTIVIMFNISNSESATAADIKVDMSFDWLLHVIDSSEVDSIRSITSRKDPVVTTMIPRLNSEFNTNLFSKFHDCRFGEIYADARATPIVLVISLLFTKNEIRILKEKLSKRMIGNMTSKVLNEYNFHFIDSMLIMVNAYTMDLIVAREINTVLYQIESKKYPIDVSDSLFYADTVTCVKEWLCESDSGLKKMRTFFPVDTIVQDVNNLLIGLVDHKTVSWIVDTTSKKCKSITFDRSNSLQIAKAVSLMKQYTPEISVITKKNIDLIKCRYNYARVPVRIFSEDTRSVKYITFYSPFF